MLKVLVQFRVLVRSMSWHYRQVERECGVSGAQVWAMAQIAASSGITVGELARQLAIHQSTASNMLETLERAGLVDRRRAAHDRRVVQLYLTPQARRVLRRAPKPLRGALQQALLDLSPQALRSLHDSLDKVLRRMKLQETGAKSLLLAQIIGRHEARSP